MNESAGMADGEGGWREVFQAKLESRKMMKDKTGYGGAAETQEQSGRAPLPEVLG